ncbi:tyrosine-type recombinase/integrase [Pseudomonas lundensis]|uniref:tyrosine-type recombinase/integrase n=1 Tax=Pseudomonas lundensis TaxID=86185 RepID=UPI0018694D21|nr:site-specific integrase [Pseudomonas lundensis]
MKVVAVRGKMLDLRESLLNETERAVDGVVQVSGAGLFDSEERLMPLVSDYLSQQMETGLLSVASAKTYGQNLGYMLDFLKSRSEFSSSERDFCFIEAGSHAYRQYFKQLLEDEDLEGNTARNRDATLMSFMNKYLCVSSDGGPPRREHNPYAGGMLTPAPKSKLIKGCTMKELQVLIEATPYERERCLLQFIFDAGLRRSEVARVTLENVIDALKFSGVSFISQEMLIPISAGYCPIYIEGSKGRGDSTKPRHSIVSRATLLRIKKYHASLLYRMHSRKYPKPSLTPAFFNAEGEGYSPNSVSKLLERLSDRAKDRLEKPISPHKLRHGNAYAILSSPDLGADYLERLTIAQKSLGHAQLSTTEKYNQIAMDLYRKLIDDNAITISRAQEMEALVEKTWIRIRPEDKK